MLSTFSAEAFQVGTVEETVLGNIGAPLGVDDGDGDGEGGDREPDVDVGSRGDDSHLDNVIRLECGGCSCRGDGIELRTMSR